MNTDEGIDPARIKLLTLLNVAAAKPTTTTTTTTTNNRKRKLGQDRNWLAIAKQATIKPKTPSTTTTTTTTTTTITENQVAEEQEEDESNSVDLYHHHFGPQTTLLNPQALQLAQKEDGWKVASNSKTQDHRRIVSFQLDQQQEPDPPSSSNNPTLKIPKALQPVLDRFNPHELRFFDSVNQYQDVWHTGIPYDHHRAHLRTATSLWALQHILKTRAEIIKNNEHLAQLAPKPSTKKSILKSDLEGESLGDEPSEKSKTKKAEREIRDQGFTRPKVLLLLPLRSSARDWLHSLISLASTLTVKGLERFEKEYSLPPGTVDKLEAEDAKFKYPLDHRIIFRGNVDDDFFLPVKFNRKEIRLYSDFYQADLVIGSPVGLRKFIEKEGDADFMSSIEISIVDQMDVMQMQNWEHVEFVFEHLNRIPKKPRDTDFSRVKPWYLDSEAHHLRQSVMFSAHPSAEQHSLFRKLDNLSGKRLEFHETSKTYSVGLVAKVRPGIQQTWRAFDLGPDPLMDHQLRFDFFQKNILGPLQQSALVKEGLAGILVFVPSYFDFVRLENLFRSIEDLKFAAISEYSTPSEISAARSSFFNRHVSYLLVSERFHFFHRYKLRGARQIIFYAPPYHPEYYLEFVNQFPFLPSQNQPKDGAPGDGTFGPVDVKEVSVQVLFSKLDHAKIQPIIGLADSHKILKNLDHAHSFTFV
ncbi:rRNA-binding ribosome biosynthesis protein utp25 [Puccinia graminis f. sp. tritici]|uniref:U3 small nucleolar RNA-associated protein 25 n=1 Tax=Puccinia graminis f. sp. tritici TaxID=56615 RepID=A0A5B0RKC2_PUCGR|nr:rRNA-binding ribosome biosynthesis protein utp25 [Puccinia graminis f. sp. tritici]